MFIYIFSFLGKENQGQNKNLEVTHTLNIDIFNF
jgi:hypothetical protein